MSETRYARSGGANIAYQVIGEGPVDLVYVPGWISNLELAWEDPEFARFLQRLGSFSRFIMFDKRGLGLSDPAPVGDLPDFDSRVADLKAVMDAGGVERAVLFGHSDGGATALAFAASYPERCVGLIVYGSYAKRTRSDDYPWAPTGEERQAQSEQYEQIWADPVRIAELYAPRRASDEAFVAWISRWARHSASPRAAAAFNDASSRIDVTAMLPQIRVPSLLLYRVDDQDVKVEEGRYIASKIPNATLVELAGADHWLHAGDTENVLQEIEEFVTGHRSVGHQPGPITTVLFTDIARSTDVAVELGDRKWRGVVDRHNRIARTEFAVWRGTEINTTGDGFLATFDRPEAAIRCAQAISQKVRRLGIEIRCGVHTGQVETIDGDLAGLGVHIGARIADIASGGEVLVSRTVKDLLMGSEFEFESRGAHSLKGVPDAWELFAVA